MKEYSIWTDYTKKKSFNYFQSNPNDIIFELNETIMENIIRYKPNQNTQILNNISKIKTKKNDRNMQNTIYN